MRIKEMQNQCPFTSISTSPPAHCFLLFVTITTVHFARHLHEDYMLCFFCQALVSQKRVALRDLYLSRKCFQNSRHKIVHFVFPKTFRYCLNLLCFSTLRKLKPQMKHLIILAPLQFIYLFQK